MNFSYLQAACLLIFFGAADANGQHNPLITMKVKRVIYEFIDTLKDIDTTYIRCEATPKDFNPCDELFVDTETNVPVARFSYYFPSRYGDVVYLDNEIVEDIRKDFTLSEKVKSTLLYRIGILKISKEKYHLRNKMSAAGVLSFLSLEIAFFAWIENNKKIAKLLTKIGAGLGVLSGLLLYIESQKPTIDPQQDLIDTVQKAHDFALIISKKNK